MLKTLSFLSHSPKFSASGKVGFPKKPSKLEKKIQAEEKLYGELAGRVGGEGTPGKGNQTRESIYSPERNVEQTYYYHRSNSVHTTPQNLNYIDEDIYNSICSPNKSRSVLPSFSKSKKSKRDFPIKEFLESEEKYLTNLCMVRDHFMLQLQHLSPEAAKIIFYRLPDLIVLHGSMFRSLKSDEKGVGRTVLEHSARFVVYKEYVTNLDQAMAVLEAEESRDKVKKELVKCQLAAKSPFPLSAHITLPFQRLLKYHLLLAEVLKHTPEDHPEHMELTQAHDYMKNFNSEVNEAKREKEETEKQMIQDEKDKAILANLTRTIKSMRLENNVRLQDFGRLRRAGELEVDGKNTDYAFLLDSILLVCNKPRLMQQRYRFKFSVKLADFEVDLQQPSQDTIRLLPRTPGLNPILLIPRSPPELDLWLRALLTCMDLIFPSENQESGHQPLLSCLAGSRCSYCDRPFVGVLGQGYRCRACPALLHKHCLAELVCQALEEPVEMRRSGSMALPSFLDRDSNSRASMGSTLSIASHFQRGSPNQTLRQSGQVEELQEIARREQEQLPVVQQAWWAGQIDLKTATDRIKSLPMGTFLVRGSLQEGILALDLKAKSGVKHMKIYVEDLGSGKVSFSFSEARSFPTLPQLIGFYRYFIIWFAAIQTTKDLKRFKKLKKFKETVLFEFVSNCFEFHKLFNKFMCLAAIDSNPFQNERPAGKL